MIAAYLLYFSMTPAILLSHYTAFLVLLLSHLLELHPHLLLAVSAPAGPKKVQSNRVKHLLRWLILVICRTTTLFHLLLLALPRWLHRILLQ